MHNVPAAEIHPQQPASDTPQQLSHGAQLCELALRRRRQVRGWREVGEAWLARQLRRSTRQVRRYTGELEQAGRLERRRPKKAYRPAEGWRSTSCTRYRLASGKSAGQPDRTYMTGRPPSGDRGALPAPARAPSQPVWQWECAGCRDPVPRNSPPGTRCRFC